MYVSILIYTLFCDFQIRNDIRSKLAGLVDKVFCLCNSGILKMFLCCSILKDKQCCKFHNECVCLFRLWFLFLG